ncbi:alginate export family protein [Novosphingobium terrae]|uniref:alginate export family protein n=1 Tax=Novosphingobium terrae TaxID=2726189 RepID=UPI00197FCE9B|nr:alginate export family protein [Novosphingobium terrae]
MSMLVLLAAAATTIADGDALGTDASDTPSSIAAPASKPRPAIMFNRWQEDWSVLENADAVHEPLDELKYIPLADDPKTYLSLGANLRERFETNNAPSFGTNPANPRDSYVISRTEIHADLHAGPVQAFVQLQSDFAPGKQVRSPVDSNRLDLEQAFVAFAQKVGPGTLKLRAGRQQFAFDLQRFVAARDGPNVRQSFDALWGDYEIGKWRLIGYYSRPVTNRDGHPFDDASSSRNLFYGARVERLVLGGKELSAYWSRFTNDNANWLTAKGAEQRDVWDIRFAGKQGRWDWDLEGMGQTGHVTTSTGSRKIRAWAFGSRSGYTFAATPLTPRVGLQVDGASGNRANSTVLGTFNPLFPNGYYVSLSGYTGYVNFLHVKPSLTLQPTKTVTVMGAIGLQWRMTTADAIYTQPTVAVARTAGTGGRWTGAYGQFRTDWKMSGHWSSAVEAVHFDAGSTIRNAGGHDGNYLGVEIKFGW